MNAVELFGNPILDEVVLFVGNNKNVGPRLAAVHAVLIERVLPARARYRAAVEAASKARVEMDKRHAQAVKDREALVAQLAALDLYVNEQIPAEISAADAEPAAIAEQANASLTKDEIGIAESALQNYFAFRA